VQVAIEVYATAYGVNAENSPTGSWHADKQRQYGQDSGHWCIFQLTTASSRFRACSALGTRRYSIIPTGTYSRGAERKAVVRDQCSEISATDVQVAEKLSVPKPLNHSYSDETGLDIKT
jgi:hypothetical protein